MIFATYGGSVAMIEIHMDFLSITIRFVVKFCIDEWYLLLIMINFEIFENLDHRFSSRLIDSRYYHHSIRRSILHKYGAYGVLLNIPGRDRGVWQHR